MRYDASGVELVSWNTNRPDGTHALGRGIGIDGAGIVYVLTSTEETYGLVQRFQADGTLIDAQPFAFSYTNGFAVDALGNIYGGDDTDDTQTVLLALGPDGTRYTNIRGCCGRTLDATGPGSVMSPAGGECGGPSNLSTSCFSADYAAATDSRLYVSGYSCNAASECAEVTKVYGAGPDLLGTIPAFGPLALGTSGTAYIITSGGIIEKWVPNGSTATAQSSWGALKARWR